VAISIIGILTTIAIANFRVGEKSDELDLAVQDLVSELKNLQIKAFAGELKDSAQTDPPAGGYGLNLTICATPVCTYTLFVDEDEDDDYDLGEEIEGGSQNFSQNIEVFEFYTCPIGGCASVSDDIDITFDLYQQGITIKSQIVDYSDDEFKIYLKHQKTSETKNIIIFPQAGTISY